MKKYFAVLFLFIFLITGIIPTIAGGETVISVKAPVFKKVENGQETEIHAITSGKIKTEVPVSLENGLSGEAVLAVALYDANNQLMQVNFDHQTVSSSGTVLSAQLEVTDGLKMKYFVWDSFQSAKPFALPPQKPYSVTAPHVSNREVVLNWSKGIGDITGYEVYRNGTFVGETPVTRFADAYLDENSTYQYSIKAKSKDVVSEDATIEVTTGAALNVAFGDTMQEKNLSFLVETSDKADAYTEVGTIGGKTCRRSVPIPIASPTRFGLFYFSVQKNLITPDDRNITFEVTYFDNGTGGLTLQYNAVPADGADPATSNIAKPVALATRTNTNTWKTARVSVTDANFRKAAAIRNSDFRITGGSETYIARVAVEKTEYFGKSAAVAKIDTAYPELMQMSYRSNTALEFNALDTAIASADKNVNIELTYTDSGSNNLLLSYKSTDNVTKTAEIPVTNTNAEVSKLIQLSDAKFDGTINSYADFTISLKDSSTLPANIKKVKASKQVYQYGTASLAGSNLTYKGIKLLTEFTGDSINTAANIGGRDCRKIESMSGAIKHFYFRIDDETVYGAKDNQVTLSYSYYDEGTQQMVLQYNTFSNAYQALSLGLKTDTKQWLTKSVTLSNACFTNAQSTNYLADFRIKVDTGTLYISDISVLPGKTTYVQRNVTPTIFLAGDSTCEALSATYYPREGWGMEIGSFFLSSVTINNQAKGGKSSKSFLSGADPTAVPAITDDGRMAKILSSSKPGDYIFIQFGHNDRNSASAERYTSPTSLEENDTSYRYNLKRFVQIVSTYGIKPIFLTSIRERKFSGTTDTLLDDGIEAYRTAMKEVASELGVPVIDAGTAHKNLLQTWGNEASKALFLHFTLAEYPNYPATLPDNTHISKTGAVEVSKIIVNGIKGGAAEHETLASLVKFINNSVNTTPATPQS